MTASLSYNGKSLLLKTDFDLKYLVDRCKTEIGGLRWNPTDKVWDVPATLLAFNKLADIFGSKLTLDLNAEIWSHDEIRLADELLTAQQPNIAHPNIIEHSTLYDYQKHAVQWVNGALTAKESGLLLADDLGLGKTAESLVALCQLSKVLIVCSKSKRRDWVTEAKKFADLEVNAPQGDTNFTKAELLALSAQDKYWICLTRDMAVRCYEVLSQINWDGVIIDEVHFLRNSKTRQSQVFNNIKSGFRLGLSGSLAVNKPLDLYETLAWAQPKRFGNFWHFAANFLEWDDYVSNSHVKNVQLLGETIKPFVLKRLREDVQELPPLTEQVITVDMDSTHRADYDKLAKESVRGSYKGNFDILGQLVKLRQMAAAHEVFVARETPSAKLEAIIDIIQDSTKPVIVFSNFVSTLNYLAFWLDTKGIPASMHIGPMNEVQREIARDKVNNNEIRALLATIQTGGEGLNLTGAATVVFLDLPYTFASYFQAIGRVHRNGQTEPVHAITLLASGSVDQQVYNIVKSKKELSNLVIATRVMDNLRLQYPEVK